MESKTLEENKLNHSVQSEVEQDQSSFNSNLNSRTKAKAIAKIKEGEKQLKEQEDDHNEILLEIPQSTIQKLKDLHKVFGLAVNILIDSSINYLVFYLNQNNLDLNNIVQELDLDIDKDNNIKTDQSVKKTINLSVTMKKRLETINMLNQIPESIIIGTELMYRHNYLFQPLDLKNNEVNNNEQS